MSSSLFLWETKTFNMIRIPLYPSELGKVEIVRPRCSEANAAGVDRRMPHMIVVYGHNQTMAVAILQLTVNADVFVIDGNVS